MIKVLIIRGEDRHTYRLEQSMQMCGVHYKTVTEYQDIPSDLCDITFVDPSLSFDPTSKINSKHTLFFDCEDGPRDFNPGVAYEAMKDRISFYAKMNWVKDDRGDGIKNIGYPLSVYMNLSQVAALEVPPFTYKNAIPFFVGAGTYIGGYEPEDETLFQKNNDLEISSLAKYDDGKWMYNQRVDWLLSLRDNNIPHVGGIVFKTDNVSKEWQSKYFGKGMSELETPPLDYRSYLSQLFQNRIGLCPTGHDRMSWRTFDIMATGAILIWTDSKEQQSMYMPKEFTTVKDGENIGKTLLQLQPDYKELWKAGQENRKVFKGLTPQKIWDDFMEQMK
jgi:hypothetical protein